MTRPEQDRTINVEPRAWQTEALGKWSRNMEGIAEVVTGGGKTVFGLLCALEFLKRFPVGKVVVVVPTIALADQWATELTASGLFSEHEVGVHADGEHPALKPTRCHIMTLVAARTDVALVSATEPTMLIVDECHRIGSRANAQALDGEQVATLGLSATPDREYDDLFETVVAPVLGNVFYRYSYQQALEDGVISPFKLTNVEVPFTAEEAEKYASLTKAVGAAVRRRNAGEEVDEMIKRLLQQRAAVSISAAYRIPVAVQLMDGRRSVRTIIFHERIAAAEKIAGELRAGGHRVARYHSGLGPSMRRSELLLFRRGIADVLVTCRALDEGLDVPNTQTALIVASTASRRQRIQRVGRALRPKSDGAVAEVVSLFATRSERERLEDYETSSGAEQTSWFHAAVG